MFSKVGKCVSASVLVVVFKEHIEAAMQLHSSAGYWEVPSRQPGSAAESHLQGTLSLFYGLSH